MKILNTQKLIIYSILILSLVIIFLNDIFLKNIPEIFFFGNEIGNILSSLSLAYISSFIFYLVVVVLKEKRDKKNIYESVHYLTNVLLTRAYAVYDHTIEASEKNKNDYKRDEITKDDFLDICKTAKLHTYPKYKRMGYPNTVKAKHSEFISKDCIKGIDIYADKIFSYMPFLDSEYVKLINNIRNCVFYVNFGRALPLLAKSEGINVRIAESMFEYFQLVRELEKYNNFIHKKYFCKKK